MGENCDARTDVLHVEKLVRSHENRHSTRGKPTDQLLHLARADGVESRRRLIEDQQLRTGNEGTREGNAPSHSLRESADRAIGMLLQPNLFQQLVGAYLRRTPIQLGKPRIVEHRLFCGEERVQIGKLGQIPKTGPGRMRTRG